jgi:hypothetical protein
MKMIEGRDTKRFDIAEYMKNFNREQSKDSRTETNKKLTLADLKNYREKSSKTFLIDKQSDY